ncbi:MAG: hypothetical protein JKY48_04625, partial [Flavobacteriales bacterium]|nr:hypothetical protein [Flavobacteriales bacterium]
MSQNCYVLGTGLSHNGSAVLLKNGKICVAIEKERLSRIKHDGGNDTLAIQYCLDAEGIQLSDIDLVVQCANFELPERDQYCGKRLFADSEHPKIITISHHLAHAYSAVGTSPFQECMVMVIDGCGSPLDQFLALQPEEKGSISKEVLEEPFMQCEKDSYYHFDGQKMIPLWKDFSVMAISSSQSINLNTTLHSIGGFYAAISHYVFGNMDDVGKLMGLAPFGQSGVYSINAFTFKDARLLVQEEWKTQFDKPSEGYEQFKANFKYYANVAKWAQEQVEKAVIESIRLRINSFPHKNLCFSGGVALNAVANTRLIEQQLVENIYFEPAAADNGLALGCAYYGWLESLNMPLQKHNKSTCFGKKYTSEEIEKALESVKTDSFVIEQFNQDDELLQKVAKSLNEGKTVAWFHSGSEFGPRSLGRRSIIAHPGKEGLKDHINKNIKFREDFRPFAPSVLAEMAPTYFESSRESPYMIQVDRTKPEYLSQLQNVTHQDGSARVQTVDDTWNQKFAALLAAFEKESGIPVLLNTSLNRKGMPMVETPEEALQLFKETALNVLVLENCYMEKKEVEITNKILSFLANINVNVVEKELNGDCFLPGLALQEGVVLLDRKKLKYPGDLLHEAGHLAVTPEEERKWIGTDKMDISWPSDGDEIAAVLWSYAALRHLEIPAKVVFHPNGYKNESEWLIDQFDNKKN